VKVKNNDVSIENRAKKVFTRNHELSP